MDTAEAEQFLRDHLGSGVGEVVALASGEWSRAFAFRYQGAGRVVRFSSYREDFEKDRLASRFASPELPVPPVLTVAEGLGGFFAISELAPGVALDDQSAERMEAVLPSFLASLDALRTADLSSTVGYGRWDADGRAPFASWRDVLLDVVNGPAPAKRTPGWRERLARSPAGLRPFEESYERLAEIADDVPGPRYLVHADLLNRNVLVRGSRVTAVLDWGNAMYGDFLYDIAWFDFWSPWYPQWQGLDFLAAALRHYESIGLDVPRFEERLRCCELHIGLDGMAYSAFKERWSDVDAIATRTLAVARSGRLPS